MGPAELPDLFTRSASEKLKGEGAFRPSPLTKGQASNCSPSPFHPHLSMELFSVRCPLQGHRGIFEMRWNVDQLPPHSLPTQAWKATRKEIGIFLMFHGEVME
jgi:hypothetical protein